MVMGSRIKEVRIKKKYTQDELGKLLGVSKVSICHYESGTRTPTMKNFLDLVEILDVDPNYILGRDVDVVSEGKESLKIKLAKEDLQVIKEIKQDKNLYNKLCKDPKRTIELINRLLNK